jgi:hypothetical protein
MNLELDLFHKRPFLALSKNSSIAVIFIGLRSFKTRPKIKVSKTLSKLGFGTLKNYIIFGVSKTGVHESKTNQYLYL